jgi:hypothetical protein
MTLLGRVITAYVTGRRPPLFMEALYLPCFSGIWVVINCFPFDLVFSYVLNNKLFLWLFQLFFSLIQVRETCHGVDIGLRAFPSAPVGAILVAMCLACTESVVWLWSSEGSRQFSNRIILKNLMSATLYFALTQYPDWFPDWVDTSREFVKMALLGMYLFMTLIDCLIFGICGRNAVDNTVVSYLVYIFSYKGDK